MLLGDGSILWVLVIEDEVQLVVIAALVGSEHDRVLGLVIQLLKIARVGEQLEVGTTAFLSIAKLHFILNNERLRLEQEGLVQLSTVSMVASFALRNQSQVPWGEKIKS